MQQVAVLPTSSIAKKALMAVTGAIWIGYLALHMWGRSLHWSTCSTKVHF